MRKAALGGKRGEPHRGRAQTMDVANGYVVKVWNNCAITK